MAEIRDSDLRTLLDLEERTARLERLVRTITGAAGAVPDPLTIGELRLRGQTATDYSQIAESARLAADTGNRFELYAFGELWFGSGAGATDAGVTYRAPQGLGFYAGNALRASLSSAGVFDATTLRQSGSAVALDYTVVHSTGAETVAGAKTFTSPLLLPDGSSAAPALAFASDPDTGIKSNGANELAIVVGANAYVTVDATGNLTINGGFLCWTGAPGAPGLAANSDPDTGLRWSAANELRAVTGGTDRLILDANGDVILPATQRFRGDSFTAAPGVYTQPVLSSKNSGDGAAANRVELYAWGALWFGPGGAATGTDAGMERGTGAANDLLFWAGGLGSARARFSDTIYVRNASGAERAVGADALAVRTAATAAIANTETVVLSATLPANFMAAGTTFRFRASGVSTASTATAGSTFRVRIGSTTLTGNIAASLTGTSAVGTAIPFAIECLVTVRTAGAGGSILGVVIYNSNAPTGNMNVTIAVGQLTATVAVDTTAQKLLELTYISGVATTTTTFHNAVLELVKA